MPETYQTLVYSEQGGGAKVIKSNGIVRGYSGGIMSTESGFIFALASQAILAKDIARIIHSANTPYVITASAAATTLAESNLPKNCRIVKIVANSTVISGSFWLTSCSAGCEVFLHLVGAVNGGFTAASTQIDVSLSGCSLIGSVGAALSGFEMHTSLASNCMVHLLAIADNCWAIVGQKGDLDE